MMKRIVSMLLLTGTLLIGNTVFAFYADESSAVNFGMVQSYSRSAINVIDDDGTAYTFVYDNRPHSDLGFWKLESEDQWHQWEFGLQQQSHMEQLASCGFYALKTLGKL